MRVREGHGVADEGTGGPQGVLTEHGLIIHCQGCGSDRKREWGHAIRRRVFRESVG